ncbi:Dor1-like family-domain-containing protein [Pavlovales sp. CCMP2436]|nr:Dor1-like family-domain-containing protein [Pavlovales sp. CCMP2436]
MSASILAGGESVEKLQRMKAELDANNRALQSQVVELLRTSCPQLVQNAQSVGQMLALATDASERIGSAVVRLPGLSCEIDSLLLAAQKVIGQRERGLALLRHQSGLLELLEVPSLMDTCIRSNLIDEALELRATVHAVCAAHPHVRVLGKVLSEVDAAAQLLHEQLRATLKGEVGTASLPVALAAVGHLRRLGQVDERQLRTCFLSGRAVRLKAEVALAQREHSEVYRQCLALLQLMRERWFDTATHSCGLGAGTATYAEESTAHTALQSTGIQHTRPGELGAGGAVAVDEAAQELRGWLVDCAVELQALLEALLPRVADLGLLANVLEQSLHSAASLARVGADVRALLLPAFESVVLGCLDRSLALARRHWHASLVALARAPLPLLPGGSGLGAAAVDDRSPLPPPLCLLQWPPLAVLCNCLLLALAEQRKCSLCALQLALRLRLRATLVHCVEALAALAASAPPPAAGAVGPSQAEAREVREAREGREPPLLVAVRAMAVLLLEALLPFLDTAVGCLYGAKPPAAAAGGGAAGGGSAQLLYRPGPLTKALRPVLAPLAAKPKPQLPPPALAVARAAGEAQPAEAAADGASAAEPGAGAPGSQAASDPDSDSLPIARIEHPDSVLLS